MSLDHTEIKDKPKKEPLPAEALKVETGIPDHRQAVAAERGRSRSSTDVETVELAKADGSILEVDRSGKVAKVTYPDGSRRSFTYRPDGSVSEIADDSGTWSPVGKALVTSTAFPK